MAMRSIYSSSYRQKASHFQKWDAFSSVKKQYSYLAEAKP